MKSLILKLITFFARRIIQKHDPKVIAITGSYGKTSAKEAIFSVLNTGILETVRANEGNLNSDWGLPLTVIGSKKPDGILGWLKVVLHGFQVAYIGSTYPDVLILEMGADKPGDIAHLLTIAQPDIAVLTGIGHTHIEFFGSPQEVAKEKFMLVNKLKNNGTVIYNADDNFLSQFMADKNVRNIVSYGTNSENDVRASQIRLEINNLASEKSTADDADHIGGVGFQIRVREHIHQAYVANVVGRSHVYAALVAIAVADVMNVDHEKSVDLLENYKPAPGRMRLLGGIKHTTLIDDTYNASPESAVLALDTLVNLSCQGKRWAVLGEMLELGNETKDLHTQLGKRVAELTDINYLITIGKPAHFIADGARTAGKSEDTIYEFDNKETAGSFLQDRIKQGDLILFKASRGVVAETPGTRFEKLVLEVMEQPQKAKDLLVVGYYIEK